MTENAINLDLEVAPTDPVEAENYLEIHALWKTLSGLQNQGRDLSDEEFSTWESSVLKLLRPAEIARFRKPLRPHIPISDDTIQFARHFHLVKILWARKGVEKLMKDTGF